MAGPVVTPAAAAITGPSITLREYVDMRFMAVDARFQDQEKAVNAALVAAKSAVDAALAAAQKAVDKAEGAAERRFEGMNEFRAALGDATRLNMPRTEAEQQINSLSDKVSELTVRLQAREDRGEGKGQMWSVIGSVIAVVASIGTIIVVLSRLS
jgi:hypothetical protein